MAELRDTAALIERAPVAVRDVNRTHAKRLLDAGLVERAHGHLRITPAGRAALASSAFPRSE